MEQNEGANILKKYLGYAIFIAIIAIGYYVFHQPSSPSNIADKQEELYDKVLMKIAIELNKAAPIMIDSITQFENAISSAKNTLQYNYTVNVNKDDFDIDAYINYSKPQLINNLKTHPSMEIFRKNKVTLIYNYKDKNGAYFYTITITPDLYIDK